MELLKTLLLLAVLALFLFVGLLLIVGGGDGHAVEDGSIRVRGSKTLVMERLSDPVFRKRWVVGCESVTRPSLRYPAEGMRWTEIVVREGVEEQRNYEVVELDANERLVLETSWGGRPVRLSYELHSYRTGSQTTISYTLEARFEGWKERVLEPLLVRSLFAEMQQDMESLARLDLNA